MKWEDFRDDDGILDRLACWRWSPPLLLAYFGACIFFPPLFGGVIVLMVTVMALLLWRAVGGRD